MLLVIDDAQKTIRRWQPDFEGRATLTHEIRVSNFDHLDLDILSTMMIGTSPVMMPHKVSEKKTVGKARKK